MNERQRFAYLDAVKCLAMLCVCLYHFPLLGQTGALFSPASLLSRYLRGLNAVCVPLFMMVNGALVLNAPFDARKHGRRTLKLFLGVYVWYVITQVIGHLVREGGAYVAANAGGILVSALYLYEYDGVALTHLWFVQMLVAVYVLTPLLRAAVETKDEQLRRGVMGFGFALLALCFLVHDFDHVKSVLPVLRRLDLSCLETMNPLRGIYGAMIVYFLLGGALHRNRDCLKGLGVKTAAAMIAVGSAGLFLEWLIMSKKTNSAYDIVYYGYNCLPTLLMAVGVFLLAQRCAPRLPAAVGKAVGFVGRNTLAIYYLHWIFGLILEQGPALGGGFPLNLVKAAAMVALGALLGEGMRRVPVLRWLV